MLDAGDFRRIALGMTGATEGAHQGHPDFRVQGRIFATLHADPRWGMVKLTPDQQQEYVGLNPAAFAPESGAWGRQGYTAVRLDATTEEELGTVLTMAWQNVARARGATKPPTRPRRRQ